MSSTSKLASWTPSGLGLVCVVGMCLSVASPSALARAEGLTMGMPMEMTLADGVISESIGNRIVRFHADEAARAGAYPSMALLEQAKATGPAPEGFGVNVKFSKANGRQVASVAIEEGTSLYGTGEVAGPLLRNGRVVECWNTDAYGYQDDAKSLYQSHPWVLAVRKDGTAYGVLADTTYRCAIDLTKGIEFAAMGPAYPVIVIERDSPQEVVRALAELTGKIAMPPRWALGYHQCRYSYFPDKRVADVAKEFRTRKIPCDVIWLDIDYMNEFRCFTFDSKTFPYPGAMSRLLATEGFNTVWMIDPGIKEESGYFVSDQLIAGKHGVLRSDGKIYRGEVWPGWCNFPDFTNKATREWWAGLYPEWVKHAGVGGVWNDMNEPAVFNVPSKTMPEDNLHRPDPAIRGPVNADISHARFHNVYGMLMVQATHEGMMKAEPGKRPFVLSRANYIGGQRYAATWTGDNTANWYHLETSIPMVLNLSLSGNPFTGPDIGGFAGNGDGAMFARWMGFGAMFPFARGHTGKENIDKEPWSFGPEVENTCRQAIERRYRLIPYYYTMFYESSLHGDAIAQPLFFADPKDPALRSEDDAFLLGGNLLISAAVTPDRQRVPVLPKPVHGVEWRKFDFGDGDNVDLPALYLRPGSIVPTGMTGVRNGVEGEPRVPQHTQEAVNHVELLICLDHEGKASGTMYSDSGDGYADKTQNLYRYIRYDATKEGDKVRVKVTNLGGDLVKMIPGGKFPRRVVARVMLPDHEVIGQAMDGEEIVVDLK